MSGRVRAFGRRWAAPVGLTLGLLTVSLVAFAVLSFLFHGHWPAWS